MGDTYPGSHVLDQLLGIAFATSTRLASKVNEVIRVVVPITHNVVLGVVQEGQELVIETGFAFRGELVPEAPHAGAEDGPEIIHVFSRRHPISIINTPLLLIIYKDY